MDKWWSLCVAQSAKLGGGDGEGSGANGSSCHRLKEGSFVPKDWRWQLVLDEDEGGFLSTFGAEKWKVLNNNASPCHT